MPKDRVGAADYTAVTPYATAQQASAYRDSSVLTAPSERLVVMLYDGAHRFLFQATHAMRSGDISLMNNRLQRAEAIINELRRTLDFENGGEIAPRLEAIYTFCQRHLLDAPSCVRRGTRSPLSHDPLAAKSAEQLVRASTLGLIGRTVTYTDVSKASQTGVVSGVDIAADGTATITVGDRSGIDAGKVTQVR